MLLPGEGRNAARKMSLRTGLRAATSGITSPDIE